jgi:hypothetical protein
MFKQVPKVLKLLASRDPRELAVHQQYNLYRISKKMRNRFEREIPNL